MPILKRKSLHLLAAIVAVQIAFCFQSALADDQAQTPSIEQLESKCELKVRSACVSAAHEHHANLNINMALVMYKRACFLKHKDSCIKLAELALEANHSGMAREGLEEGCRYSSKWACNQLAKMDQKSKSENQKIDNDPAKSMLVWSLACTKGSASGCRKQAEAEKMLGQKDSARASYLRGCSLGDKTSCAEVVVKPAH